MVAAEFQDQKLMTADELFQLPEEARYELVRGVLIDMGPLPGYEHGLVASRVAYAISSQVVRHRLGTVFSAGTGFCLGRNPDTVRAADVAFVSGERIAVELPEGYLDLAPDLVAEVVSPSDDPNRIQEKGRDWLEAGVRLVLVVYPGSRQVITYRSLREVAVLTDADALSAPDILPGFSLPVADLFV